MIGIIIKIEVIMKKIGILGIFVLLTGCATSGDVTRLNVQVDALKAESVQLGKSVTVAREKALAAQKVSEEAAMHTEQLVRNIDKYLAK